MGKIKLTTAGKIVDGKLVTFKAPCSSENATCIIIGVNTECFILDAAGNNIAGVPGLWAKGAMLSVIFDTSTSTNKAYVQNANTSREPIGTFTIMGTNPSASIFPSSGMMEQSIFATGYNTEARFSDDEMSEYISLDINNGIITILKDCTVTLRKHSLYINSKSLTDSYIERARYTFGSTNKDYYAEYNGAPHTNSSVGTDRDYSSLPYGYVVRVPEYTQKMTAGQTIKAKVKSTVVSTSDNKYVEHFCNDKVFIFDVYA